MEEEAACLLGEPGALEEGLVACGVECGRLALGGLRGGFPLGEDDVVAVGEPSAGVGERFAEVSHHEVDGAAVCVACEASVGVGARVEREAGMVVVVEGAEALVPRDVQSDALGHSLYGELAEPGYFEMVHGGCRCCG